MATDKSTWEVDRFARKVKRLILAGDFQGLCGEACEDMFSNAQGIMMGGRKCVDFGDSG